MPWVRAALRAAFDDRGVMAATCAGHRLALFALADGIYATSDHCPHMGGSLSEGCSVQGYIECPVHHALFDIRTGAADGSVTDQSVTTFPVKVEGDEIFVDVPEREEPSS